MKKVGDWQLHPLVIRLSSSPRDQDGDGDGLLWGSPVLPCHWIVFWEWPAFTLLVGQAAFAYAVPQKFPCYLSG